MKWRLSNIGGFRPFKLHIKIVLMNTSKFLFSLIDIRYLYFLYLFISFPHCLRQQTIFRKKGKSYLGKGRYLFILFINVVFYFFLWEIKQIFRKWFILMISLALDNKVRVRLMLQSNNRTIIRTYKQRLWK